MPNYNHIPNRVLITGASGSGKTTLLMRRLKELCGKCRLFVFDPEHEIASRTGTKAARDHVGMCAQAAALNCMFDPCHLYPGRYSFAFKFFADFTFQVSMKLPGRKVFVCDELQKFCGPSIHEMPLELSLILETGRRYQLDFIGVSQSPNLINTRVRNQLTEVVTFRQVDDRAVDFLESIGFNGKEIQNLAPGQYCAKNLINGDLSKGKVFKASLAVTKPRTSHHKAAYEQTA